MYGENVYIYTRTYRRCPAERRVGVRRFILDGARSSVKIDYGSASTDLLWESVFWLWVIEGEGSDGSKSQRGH